MFYLKEELKKNCGLRNKVSILNYRIGFMEEFCTNNKIIKLLFSIAYKMLRIINLFIGNNNIPPKNTFIDWGLIIPHGFNNIIINCKTKIGKNCTLYQGTTIGTIDCTGKFPQIGDNVYVGANCLIIGATNIGNNCKIGAGTKLVNKNIPSNSTVINPIEYKIITN